MSQPEFIPVARPLIGEEEKRAVLEVLDSGMLAQGPRVQAFEEAFAEMCGVRFAVATNSGTAALHLALLAHGIGSGDEVIIPSFTFIATANSILYTGARPVFVDIDPLTFNMAPEQVERAITPRTRAILPVHLFGLCCDMPAIQRLASRHGLVIIEDACQSHGAGCPADQFAVSSIGSELTSQRAGSFGTGTFSLYPTKNMTSAEGGMITTNSEVVYEHCRMIRQQGMRRRYHHDALGFNFRMTDVHAAIGLEQLKKLPRFNQARQENARYLTENLRGVIPPFTPPGYEHVYHQYTIRVPGGCRDALRTYLQEQAIGSEIYYLIPVHLQEYLTSQNLLDPGAESNQALSLPETERAAHEVLSLPVHPGLAPADLERIVRAVNSFFESNPRQSDRQDTFRLPRKKFVGKGKRR